MLKQKLFLLLVLLFLVIGSLPAKAEALTFAQRLKGYILLQVDSHGEAWYVYPNDLKRYPLGRPADASQILAKLGLGATHSFLTGYTIFPAAVSGKILLDVQSRGEGYYINPRDRKKYSINRLQDISFIMQKLSLGITTANLSLIPVGRMPMPNGETNGGYSSYEEKQITAGGVNFTVKVAAIDLASPGLKIITDTADDNDCKVDCPVKSLADYVAANSGFAAINGSYFCAADYSSCAADKNYFFYPVYNSRLGIMINTDQLKWPTTGPLLVFDSNNHPYFFLSTQTFKDTAAFMSAYGVQISAAIGNQPALIYNSVNIIGAQTLDDKQKTVKSYRSGIGLKDNKIYLVAAGNATVIDLANIMESLGMEQAMNLDGGGSTALYYQGSYKVGPGRDLPNAIIFKK